MNVKPVGEKAVLIYNSNIEAKLDGVVGELLEEARQVEQWGIISPLVLSLDNKIVWHGGYIAPNLSMPMSYGADENYIGQYPGTRACTVVPFYCVLISRELFDYLGAPEGDGSDIFVDANYCLHAIANGYKVLSTDAVSVRLDKESAENEEINEEFDRLSDSANGFIKKWGPTIEKHFQNPICYHTRVSAPTGFAKAVGNYMKALSEKGIDVTYNYIGGVPEIEQKPEDMYLTAVTEKRADIKDPQVVWGQAPLFFKNSGSYKIGHCEFEGEEWPDRWVPYCNMMDEVWVPTKWDREKAIKAGVNVPIHIVHQGIDPDYYHPNIAPMRIEVPQSFKFVCTAAWLPRKNLENLIKTFAKTFGRDEDVCLVLKTMNVGLVEDIQQEVEKLNIPGDSGWIYIKEEDWPEIYMPSFYTMGHAFVLPTHGEGWGLPIFEALACGLPVITTGYGAPDEVLRDEENDNKPFPGVHFLDYHLVPARTNYEYLKDAKWAEPNVMQLSEKLRYIFDNYSKEKEKALKTSDIVRDKFSWHKCVEPIIERLDEIHKK